jgi:hypothetical protein
MYLVQKRKALNEQIKLGKLKKVRFDKNWVAWFIQCSAQEIKL